MASDFAAEIEVHLQLETERLVAEGWGAEAAAHEARRRFGSVGHARERFYHARHIAFVDDLLRDVRYALRVFARDKVYVLAAVSALGVGLAANIALFALFSAVALRPLPVPAADRVVTVSQARPPVRFAPFSLADYLFYRDESRAFSDLAAGQPSHLRLAGIAPAGGGAPAPAARVAEPVIALFVTANYLRTFGVRPSIGRDLRPEDEAVSASYAALISDNYWQRRFARDPGVIGSSILVSGIRATIVGVTPRDFAGVRREVPDLWITLAALGTLSERAARDSGACCELVGRLASGATLARARTELAALAAARRRDLPAVARNTTVEVAPAASFGGLAQQVRPLYAAVQVAMLLVLLIACANVAGLLLGRAAARDREIAVRLATGASRARIMRQLITEGVLMALSAGAVSGAVTLGALRVGVRLLSALLAQRGGGTLALAIVPDLRVLAYVAAISVAAGVLFAFAPALHVTRPDLVSVLRGAGAGAGAPAARRLRGWLLAAQVAVSVALLIGASGLARAGDDLLRRDPGFRPASVLSVWLTNPEELGYAPGRARQLEVEIRERIRALPGVAGLAAASRLPLAGNLTAATMAPAERAGDLTREVGVRYPYQFVSSEYFSVMGIPLLRGRTFSEQEVRDSASVAIISDSLARRLWPDRDALGQVLFLGSATDAIAFASGPTPTGVVRVVGIVASVHGVTIGAPDVGDAYLPRWTSAWSSRIVVRADPRSGVRSEIQRLIHTFEPALPVTVEGMSGIVGSDASVVTASLAAAILTAVGLLGLLLASIGVYGMVSYAARQQRQAIGIRMALGAGRGQVLAAILRGTVLWLLRGVIAGVALGIGGIRLTNAVLEGVAVQASMLDPRTIALVPLAIATVAVLAAVLSARKATLIDPAAVLRMEA